jgi:hypothetical protein
MVVVGGVAVTSVVIRHWFSHRIVRRRVDAADRAGPS